MNLVDTLDSIIAGTITLTSGVDAFLSRSAYVDPYTKEMNYQRFIPILTFNTTNEELTIESGMGVEFSKKDIFVNTDWVVLNQKV